MCHSKHCFYCGKELSGYCHYIILADGRRAPVCTSQDKKRYIEAAEVAYKITSFIICTRYKFTKTKLNSLQRYVKADMWALANGECKLTEFFEMLTDDCHLEFGALVAWKRIVGDVYKGGMPV